MSDARNEAGRRSVFELSVWKLAYLTSMFAVMLILLPIVLLIGIALCVSDQPGAGAVVIGCCLLLVFPVRKLWHLLRGLWRSRASYLVIDEQGIHSRYLGQTVPWERVTTARLTGFNPFSRTLSIGLSAIDAYGACPERAIVIPVGVLRGDGMDAIKAIYDFPKFTGRRWHKD